MEKNTVAYLRVSTIEQDLKPKNMKFFTSLTKKNLKITECMEIKISSRKLTKERLIDSLLDKLDEGDTLIIFELSRLGRSWSNCYNRKHIG